jgi:ATP-dependent DNA helicase 2 subunit 2
MGKMREVAMPAEGGKASRTVQVTNLEWALQFVLLKVQELVRGVLWAMSVTDPIWPDIP